MIKKLLSVVFAASTMGSTASAVGAIFNEDDMKRVKDDISKYEASIKQLEKTVQTENISNQDILKQFNEKIDVNKKTLAYIKNLINKKEDEKQAGYKLSAYISNAEKANEQLKNKDENVSNKINKALEDTKTKREALLKKLINLFSEQADNKQTNNNEKNNVDENDNKVIENKQKIEEMCNRLKRENGQFIKWRDDKKIKPEDDITKETRLKAIKLGNSLRKNFDAKKAEEFINLAKESISMMEEYKANFQFDFEDLKQLQQNYRSNCDDFYRKQLKFKKWSKENNIDSEQRKEIIKKIKKCDRLRKQIDDSSDFTKVSEFIKLAEKTMDQMKKFKNDYEQQQIEKAKVARERKEKELKNDDLETIWNNIVAGNQNIDNIIKVKVKNKKTGKEAEKEITINETCGVFQGTNGLNFYKYLEGETDYIKGFENVVQHYLSNGGKKEYIPQLQGKRRGHSLDAQEVKEYLNNNGIGTYSLQFSAVFAPEEEQKLKELTQQRNTEKEKLQNDVNQRYKQAVENIDQNIPYNKKQLKQQLLKQFQNEANIKWKNSQTRKDIDKTIKSLEKKIDNKRQSMVKEQKPFVKEILKTHFKANKKSPVLMVGSGHWRTLAGYRQINDTEQILLVESQGKQLVKWVSLDSIAKEIVVDKWGYYKNRNICWDLILCAKGKQSDSDNLLEFNEAEKQKVLENVAKF